MMSKPSLQAAWSRLARRLVKLMGEGGIMLRPITPRGHVNRVKSNGLQYLAALIRIINFQHQTPLPAAIIGTALLK